MGETAIDVPMPDGAADSHLFRPDGAGPWPAVVMLTDIFGLSEDFKAMARRLCAEGYIVLLPNI